MQIHISLGRSRYTTPLKLTAWEARFTFDVGNANQLKFCCNYEEMTELWFKT